MGVKSQESAHDLAIRIDHLNGSRIITLIMSMSYRLNKVPLDLFDKPEKPRTLKGVYSTLPPTPVIPFPLPS